MSIEKKYRSFIKAVSWRILATITTVSISYLITHSMKFATSIGVLEIITKIILFYFHERVWQRLSIGRIQSQDVNQVMDETRD